MNSLLCSEHPVHIVVIDNGSTDETVSVVRQNFSGAQLIETKKNLGFGQANNIGLKLALENKADYIFLLNQDAWIEPGTIASLVRAQDENPQFGILSPLHLNGEGSALDEYFLDYFIRSDIKKFIVSEVLDTGNRTLINTHFVNAAAWLLTAGCVQKTGGFDPIFFHYGEDLNYCQRVLFRGFKIGIYLQARIYHDRENRISRPSDTRSMLKKEWIHFLNQACDIRKPGYRALIIRRFCRYSFQLGLGLISFNKSRVEYNFFMAKKTAFSLSRIRKSRRQSLNTASVPYLQTVNVKNTVRQS